MSNQKRSDFLAEEVKKHDYDRWLTTLFASARSRPAIYALLAFNVEISRVRETVSEVLLGDIRLQWWRDAVTGLQSGKTLEHPVVSALGEIIPHHSIDPDILLQIIDARARDLDPCPFKTTSDLLEYADGTGGLLNSLIFAAQELTSSEGELAARKAGAAYALCGIIRAIPYHTTQDLLLIPHDVLGGRGLDPVTVFVSENREAFHLAVKDMSLLAEKEQQMARDLIKARPSTEKSAYKISALTSLYLSRLRSGNYDPAFSNINVGVLRKISALMLS